VTLTIIVAHDSTLGWRAGCPGRTVRAWSPWAAIADAIRAWDAAGRPPAGRVLYTWPGDAVGSFADEARAVFAAHRARLEAMGDRSGIRPFIIPSRGS